MKVDEVIKNSPIQIKAFTQRGAKKFRSLDLELAISYQLRPVSPNLMLAKLPAKLSCYLTSYA